MFLQGQLSLSLRGLLRGVQGHFLALDLHSSSKLQFQAQASESWFQLVSPDRRGSDWPRQFESQASIVSASSTSFATKVPHGRTFGVIQIPCAVAKFIRDTRTKQQCHMKAHTHTHHTLSERAHTRTHNTHTPQQPTHVTVIDSFFGQAIQY